MKIGGTELCDLRQARAAEQRHRRTFWLQAQWLAREDGSNRGRIDGIEVVAALLAKGSWWIIPEYRGDEHRFVDRGPYPDSRVALMALAEQKDPDWQPQAAYATGAPSCAAGAPAAPPQSAAVTTAAASLRPAALCEGLPPPAS